MRVSLSNPVHQRGASKPSAFYQNVDGMFETSNLRHKARKPILFQPVREFRQANSLPPAEGDDDAASRSRALERVPEGELGSTQLRCRIANLL
ncbi:hypothetical protein BJF93_08140 [Xaviernesmea oryzae]|uniref:Uncharacterized protein n=1 Tax=Xaviernesmea oryzae TaxID=464029 RepID=A0A1Q9B0T2_9HYPH|nr:hypothetical protein BJF93_08140 [Xaviernesmea oryzae]